MNDFQINEKNYQGTYSRLVQHWNIDTSFLFLNHGSFGACLRKILGLQNEFRNQLEQQPLKFLTRDLPELYSFSKRKLSEFLNADNENIVFVHNATTGVNTILNSYPWQAGDEILITNHIYPACKNSVNYYRNKHKLLVKEVNIPFPIENEEITTELLLRETSVKTKLLLIDHISSATGLLFPIHQIVREFNRRKIDVLVDGAHAPGTVPLNLNELQASYYTGNCHKWLCTPKGSAFLYVRPDRQQHVFPLTISLTAIQQNRFEERFYWQGTEDPTPYLCVGDSIDYMKNLLEGGWPAIMKSNHELAIKGRQIICDTLEISLPCPDNMLSNLASIPIQDTTSPIPVKFNQFDDLQENLFQNYQIELFVTYWPAHPKRLIRISPQLYNSEEQYLLLANILKELNISN